MMISRGALLPLLCALALAAAALPLAAAQLAPPRKLVRRPSRASPAPSPSPPSPSPPPPRPPPPSPIPRPPPPPAVPVPPNAFLSSLWGAAGGAWDPSGRLTDWSAAGYMGGTAPIPDYPAAFNVRDYGAVGADGVGERPACRGCRGPGVLHA